MISTDDLTKFGDTIIEKLLLAALLEDLDDEDYTSLSNDEQIIYESTMSKSISCMDKYIDLISDDIFIKYNPNLSFDDEGELMCEWYGRLGVRANLTFGKNDRLYFIFLFHGESTKLNLSINLTSVKQISTSLHTLYHDKFVT